MCICAVHKKSWKKSQLWNILRPQLYSMDERNLSLDMDLNWVFQTATLSVAEDTDGNWRTDLCNAEKQSTIWTLHSYCWKLDSTLPSLRISIWYGQVTNFSEAYSVWQPTVNLCYIRELDPRYNLEAASHCLHYCSCRRHVVHFQVTSFQKETSLSNSSGESKNKRWRLFTLIMLHLLSCSIMPWILHNSFSIH